MTDEEIVERIGRAWCGGICGWDARERRKMAPRFATEAFACRNIAKADLAVWLLSIGGQEPRIVQEALGVLLSDAERVRMASAGRDWPAGRAMAFARTAASELAYGVRMSEVSRRRAIAESGGGHIACGRAWHEIWKPRYEGVLERARKRCARARREALAQWWAAELPGNVDKPAANARLAEAQAMGWG